MTFNAEVALKWINQLNILLKGKSYGEKVDLYNQRDVNISDW